MTDEQRDFKEHLSLFSSSAGGRGATECLRRNWTDINHHAAAPFFLPDADLATSTCLSCLLLFTVSVLYVYNTIHVLYCCVMYSPVLSVQCGANCGFNVSPVYKLPLTVLCAVLKTPQDNNVAPTWKLQHLINITRLRRSQNRTRCLA